MEMLITPNALSRAAQCSPQTVLNAIVRGEINTVATRKGVKVPWAAAVKYIGSAEKAHFVLVAGNDADDWTGSPGQRFSYACGGFITGHVLDYLIAVCARPLESDEWEGGDEEAAWLGAVDSALARLGAVVGDTAAGREIVQGLMRVCPPSVLAAGIAEIEAAGRLR
ncbi:MAG: hypothetical protein IT365_11820 [Candidatus Hydrogenedentes bacterium]|nr:hypothetical protein [Candidatus Hydrogenedentota bacterium]